MKISQALKVNGKAVFYSCLPWFVSVFPEGYFWCNSFGEPVLKLDKFESESLAWVPRLPLHERMTKAYVEASRLNQGRRKRDGYCPSLKVLSGIRKYAHSQGQRTRLNSVIPLFQDADFAVSRRVPTLSGKDL